MKGDGFFFLLSSKLVADFRLVFDLLGIDSCIEEMLTFKPPILFINDVLFFFNLSLGDNVRVDRPKSETYLGIISFAMFCGKRLSKPIFGTSDISYSLSLGGLIL